MKLPNLLIFRIGPGEFVEFDLDASYCLVDPAAGRIFEVKPGDGYETLTPYHYVIAHKEPEGSTSLRTSVALKDDKKVALTDVPLDGLEQLVKEAVNAYLRLH